MTSVSLGVLPQLTTTRTGETANTFTTTGLSTTAGTLLTFRQIFNPWLGYMVNLGYSRNVADYRSRSKVTQTDFNPYFVQSNTFELTTAYVAHMALKHRLQGFADLGGGVIIFAPLKNNSLINPGNPFARPTTTVRAAGLAGLGVDYQVSDHFAFRAEYRGLLYKQPDYGYQGLAQFRQFTVTSEPTFSLVYSLRSKHKQ